MKFANVIRPIGLDRLATWNEVLCAMSVSSEGPFKLVGGCDDIPKADSDFSGRDCNLSDDDMWLMLVSETVDPVSN